MRISVSVLSVGINLLALLLPLALLQVYDRILPNQSTGTAAVVFTAVGIALVLSGFLRAVRARIFSRISASSDYANWQAVSTAILNRGFSPEKARALTKVPVAARDVDAGQGLVGLYDAPFAVIFLCLIWFLGGNVVLAPFAVAITVSFTLLARRRPAERAKSDLEKAETNLNGVIASLSSGSTSTLASVVPMIATSSGLLRQRAAEVRAVENDDSTLMDLMQSAGLATTVLVVGFGAAQVLAGDMTTGGLAACTLLGSRAASQSIGAVVAIGRRANTKASAAVLAELAAGPNDAAVDCLKQVERAFNTAPVIGGDVLRVSAENRHAEASALATLVQHVWNEKMPPKDAILVPARPTFARGSLLENLSAFQRQHEDTALEMASELGLDAMIGRLSRGYQTEVSRTNNGGLSPGAMKRAALVQALVAAPRLVVLERPAAGLDIDGRTRTAEFLRSRGQDTVFVMTTTDEKLASVATRTVAAELSGADVESRA